MSVTILDTGGPNEPNLPDTILAMRFYLSSHFAETIDLVKEKPWLVGVVAAVWNQVQERYGGFLLSDPLWLMTAMWSLDYITGSIRAILASLRKEPEGKWCPTKSAAGVGKWACWALVFFGCFIMRSSSGRFGFEPFASLIETASILAFFTSTLRNAGQICNANWLNRFASAGEHGIELGTQKAESMMGMNGRPAHAPEPQP